MKKSTFSKVLTYILVALLVLGVAGGAAYLIVKATTPSGVYVEYEGDYYEDGDGISVEWTGSEYTAEFTINNSDDWGIYSVDDCVVKVVPNVSTDKNFTFTTGGVTYKYGNVKDLTAAFVEDSSNYGGSGVTVDEDGKFTLYFDSAYLSENMETAMYMALYRVYSSDVTLSDSYDISTYPFFAIKITTPDGGDEITMPFTVNGAASASSSDSDTTDDTGITTYTVTFAEDYFSGSVLDNSSSISASGTTINEGGVLKVTLVADSSHVILDVTVTNATVLNLDLGTQELCNTVTFTISNPTGNVVISLSADSENEVPDVAI